MISNPLILGVISNPNILKVLNPWWICQIQILYLFKISQTSYLNFNHQNLNSNAQIMSSKHTIKSFGVGGTFFFFSSWDPNFCVWSGHFALRNLGCLLRQTLEFFYWHEMTFFFLWFCEMTISALILESRNWIFFFPIIKWGL